jgi:multisubunit Na+/H+ antiporter MnhC subunit
MPCMEVTSLLSMSRVALAVGALFLIGSVFCLTRGFFKVRQGATFFGKGGASPLILIGFGLFAFGSLLFLFGVFRFTM